MKLLLVSLLLALGSLEAQGGSIVHDSEGGFKEAVRTLEDFIQILDAQEDDLEIVRAKRDVDNRGVTNLDIRDAILQLLNVVREGNRKIERQDALTRDVNQQILDKVQAMSGSGSVDKKIDNISTFLLRMNTRLEAIDRRMRRGSVDRDKDTLKTLAQESYDILALMPTYIEGTRNAINTLADDTERRFDNVEHLLVDNVDDGEANGDKRSIASVLKSIEKKLLGASTELKNIVVESGEMAESLFERVNDGYRDLTKEIKGLSNVEKVLLDTADSVMDTNRKVEHGVQRIIYKVGDLVKLIDAQLKDQFSDTTQIILSNQTEALSNLARKFEKDIGQVWRQMGIMYGQVSNSIAILEKVKTATEGYVNNTGKNLGTMEGQVEGLSERMVDVDSDLNYMLGQLSLVVQEFNQVKTGISEAMTGLSDEFEEITEYKPQTPADSSTGDSPVENNN